jgi:hypothetical protein
MSDDVENSRPCEMIQDELAELSLGLLSGRRRSEVLDHIESCSHCTAALERLATVADALLLLASEVEPPLGFELRLAEKLQVPATRPRRRRLLRASVLSAAALAIVALGIVLGAWSTSHDANHPARSAAVGLTGAHLTSLGRVLGEVVISPGSPAWMFMTINGEAWSGTVTCQLTLAGGKVETIGVFKLSDGYGAWGAPLTSSAAKVRSALLITPNGAILASAQLSA